MIRVKDLDASVGFYTQFLGLKEVGRKEIGSEAVLVFLKDGITDHEIELTYNVGKDDYDLGNQFGHLAFHVADLEEVIKKVQEKGWDFRKSRPELSSKYIFIKDPNGYDIEILERK